MRYREFDQGHAMERAALVLLQEHFQHTTTQPHAVMLTGGRTPLGLYRYLQQKPPPVDGGLRLLLSDERYVSLESAESNFGAMRPMIDALGIASEHVVHVHTELPLEEAAAQYDRDLAALLAAGTEITLGILGLGADGHLASLFCHDDLSRGEGHWAIAVSREPGPDRISVTRRLLERVQRLIFLVSGPEKAEVVAAMVAGGKGLVAGDVTRDRDAELWYAR